MFLALLLNNLPQIMLGALDRGHVLAWDEIPTLEGFRPLVQTPQIQEDRPLTGAIFH